MISAWKLSKCMPWPKSDQDEEIWASSNQFLPAPHGPITCGKTLNVFVVNRSQVSTRLWTLAYSKQSKMNRNFIPNSAVMHLFSLTAADICLSPLDLRLCGLYGPRISVLFYNSQRPQQQEGGEAEGKGIPLQATLRTWPLERLRYTRKQTHKSKEVFSHL